MSTRVIIHLVGSSADHERLLSAMEVSSLMDWSDLAVQDASGKGQVIPPGDQARLIEDAERRAAGTRTLYDNLPSSTPVTLIRPLIYACPKSASHPKHIAFEGDPVPVCDQHQPVLACCVWQPRAKGS